VTTPDAGRPAWNPLVPAADPATIDATPDAGRADVTADGQPVCLDPIVGRHLRRSAHGHSRRARLLATR
jgi:hypothetical protein